MARNPLKQLKEFGQSVWLDFIRRDLMIGGKLHRLIAEDGLRGMTSNPAIFEKSIVESGDYDKEVDRLVHEGRDPIGIYEALSQKDVIDAADLFRQVYDSTDGRDGYVSLEVNPHLAHDTIGTIEEARRLWRTLNRPNVFVKVPATDEGLPAIEQLISEGINVNITLLFAHSRYRQVADAYLAGLEKRLAQGKPIDRVASVASFFVSRIDGLVDPMLEKIMLEGGPKAEDARRARGQVAVACAKIAYRMYKQDVGANRFLALIKKGASPQRLLWASTSTKTPLYSDVKYVDALIGPNTITTVPMETLDAFRDHGDPLTRLEQDMPLAESILAQLPDLGISLDQVTSQLENDGIAKFIQPFDKLLESLHRASEQMVVHQ